MEKNFRHKFSKFIPVVLLFALLCSSLFSVFSIGQLSGNARVINYAGVVRGATQRLIKCELNHDPKDALIEKLDGILSELETGEGQFGLVKLQDHNFLSLISQMQDAWVTIKDEIQIVRLGGDKQRLYNLSEDYFELADRTVSAAEKYSEQQVQRALTSIIGLNLAILLLAGAVGIYIARQKKNNRSMKEMQEASNKKDMQLSKMQLELQKSMNEVSELVYVSDIKTYDLLFINDAGKKTFGVDKLDGRKCYEVLQGRTTPCPFCTTSYLTAESNYTWEFTNPITQKHYLLKDRLLEWEGRKARLEIAFDATESENEKLALKSALDAENIIMECVRVLYQKRDVGQSIPLVLQQLGVFFGAARAYLFSIHGQQMSNTFEWCAENTAPQQQNLQNLPSSLIDRWLPNFNRQQCVVVERVEDLREQSPEEYEVLSAQGIHNLVAAPLERGGRLTGYIGVDNTSAEKTRNITALLQTLGYFIMLAFQRAEDEQQLSTLSFQDTLTTFYNRNRYITDVDRLSNYHGPIGIVFLDVNGLKDINDQYGHDMGDKILKDCAENIKKVFEKEDLYRIGGDEFVILSTRISEKDFSEKIWELKACFEDTPLCKAAVGYQWVEQAQDVEQVIAQTDAKMYADKKEFYRRNPSSNRYRHSSDTGLHLTNPAVLREDLEQSRFIVHLQPKVSLKTRATVGAEALIRYRKEDGSLIMPDNFISSLEDNGTISLLDFYVFDFVCSKIKDWMQNEKYTCPISVNFSSCSLAEPSFVSKLVAICNKHGVDTSYLEIEITEKIPGELNLRELVSRIRKAGFLVSIDDFGTENANLLLLSTVDVDVLKIDKSLIDDICNNRKARLILETIVKLCGNMGVTMVAEGIETEEQLAVLRECGGDVAQGYLFEHPVSTDEYESNYLSRNNSPDA